MMTTTLISTSLTMGVGATLFMDAWTLLLKRLGVRTLDYAMLGRWVGHLVRGQLSHEAITQAQPVANERAWGWLMHYVIGVAFAALLLGMVGERWRLVPTLGPALAFGLCSVLVPLCVMQPAMGAGFFASRTPAPVRNCLRSLATHAVFGIGLFLVAWICMAAR
ncbi:DUF2938 domain-containing protein [Pseudomonas capeferrum]|uniref:DUF2938 domain-containing protein n=1 Tax=Pseudomonas capeferrum TaxID=1495066 RepID=UPI0015E3F49E|nr:DUF2938 domain-containing protein [Pseudomonas capeferrum]